MQKSALSLLSILIVGGCTSIVPEPTKEGTTLFKISENEFQVHLAANGFGAGRKALYIEELENYGLGVCGSSDYEVEQITERQTSTMRYVNGVFYNAIGEIGGFRIRCNELPTDFPRVVANTQEIPDDLSILNVLNSSSILSSYPALYIVVDNKTVAKLPKKQWVTIALIPGNHDITFKQKDWSGTFAKSYKLEVAAGETSIKAWSSAFSIKYEEIDELPPDSKPYLISTIPSSKLQPQENMTSSDNLQ